MILPCEIGVRTVIPAVKAIMARSIVEKHGLNEKQTGDILGLSQSAVSRYISRERGNILNIETTAEIISLIEQMVTQLMKEPNNKTEILNLFCQTCTAIRKKGLMCDHCQKEMPKEWVENCCFCR